MEENNEEIMQQSIWTTSTMGSKRSEAIEDT
jgi:hypothetical protein